MEIDIAGYLLKAAIQLSIAAAGLLMVLCALAGIAGRINAHGLGR